MELTSLSRRWEADERGGGVADAASFVTGAAERVDAMRMNGWVAEDPDVHLRPHLERTCASLPFDLRDMRVSSDGPYDGHLAWDGDNGATGAIRAAVFALAGSVAETVSYVRQRGENGSLIFEFVTGMIGDDSPFASHGHAVRFLVGGAA